MRKFSWQAWLAMTFRGGVCGALSEISVCIKMGW
jgi:hypothetical protein